MILYKHVPFNSGMSIIRSGKIGFSQPTYFNDPFDMPAYPIDKSLNPIDGAFEDVRIWGKEHIWAEKSGILSLTRTLANNLMWAHYAGMHHGMVIGVNVEVAGLTDEESNFIPAQFGDIKYVSRRPSGQFVTQAKEGMIVGATHHFMTDHYEKTSRIFLHKSIDWSYEEEVRVVKRIGDIEGDAAQTRSGSFEIIKIGDRPLYLYDMGHDSIEEIYFGGRCGESGQAEAVELIKSFNPSASVKRAVLDKNGFEIKFRNID